MNPEIHALSLLLGILKDIDTWPVLSMVAMVQLMPWIILVSISLHQQRRFENVVKMYENNVILAEEFKKMAEGYREHLIWSTQVTSEAKASMEGNQFCPIVRKNSKDV